MRARSFEAFAVPTLLPAASLSQPCYPVARHQFGWIDGVAVSESCGSPDRATTSAGTRESLSVVLRAESDDPWSSDMHTLDVYHFQPAQRHGVYGSTEDESPSIEEQHLSYAFPPLHCASLPSARGHLRCTDIALGPQGTGVWIQPRPARNIDLTAFDVHSSDTHHPLTGASAPKQELLIAAVFPGAMRARHADVLDGGTRTLWALEDVSRNWTAVDYDEARGVVALGDSHGEVLVLDLVMWTTVESGYARAG